jgi:hypothetical protein
MSNAAVSVTTDATSLVAENFERIGLTIDNQGSVTVFIGDVSTVTAATGITLAAGAKLTYNFDGGSPQYFFQSQLWGIVSSGTADVRIMEHVRTR